MSNISAEGLMYLHYVKYDRLWDITNFEFGNSGAEEINLIIDANSIIKSVYGINPNDFSNEYSIAACIINAAAHYRNFYATRYNVKSNIYIVFSRMEKSILDGVKFSPSYTNFFTSGNNGPMEECINKNLYMINTLCPYLGNIKFIISHYEPMCVCSRIISEKSMKMNVPTIIVSRDVMMVQLVDSCYDTHMLYSVKTKTGDESIYVNRMNMCAWYADMIRKSNKNILDMGKLSNPGTGAFSILLSSTTLPERGLKSIHNTSTIYKSLYELSMPNSKLWEVLLYNANPQERSNGGLKVVDIKLRWETIALIPCMARYMADPIKDDIEIVNLYDPDGVKKINRDIFANMPLDLMSL